MVFGKVGSHFASLFNGARRFAAKPWYPFFVAFLNGADIYIMVVPNDALLISAVNASPQYWFFIGALVAAGTACGVGSLASLAMMFGTEWMRSSFPTVFESSMFESCSWYMQQYGGWAIFVGAISPIIIHVFAFVGIMAEMNLFVMIIAVFLGRMVKYCTLAYLTVHVPSMESFSKGVWGMTDKFPWRWKTKNLQV